MDDWKRGFAFGAIGATAISMFSSVILASAIRHSWAEQAIEHGAARYHPTTGEFEWIDRADQPTENEHASREN